MRLQPSIRDRLVRTALEGAGPGRAVMLVGGVLVILAALAASLLLHPALVSTLLLLPVALGGAAIGLAAWPTLRPPAASTTPNTDRDRAGPDAADFERLWVILEAAIRARVMQRAGDAAADRPVSEVLTAYRAARRLTDAQMAELRELLTIRQAMAHGVRPLTPEHLHAAYRLLQEHVAVATAVATPSD